LGFPPLFGHKRRPLSRAGIDRRCSMIRLGSLLVLMASMGFVAVTDPAYAGDAKKKQLIEVEAQRRSRSRMRWTRQVIRKLIIQDNSHFSHFSAFSCYN